MRLFVRPTALVWLSMGCGAVPAPAPLPDPRPPAAVEQAPLLASSVPVEALPEPEPTAPPPDPAKPCTPEMVFVAERFCIDRYEATMVDKATRRSFSPFYPANRREVRRAIAGQKWGPAALGKEEVEPPVPILPEWERGPDTEALAVSLAHVTPQAYLSKPTALAACESAGKRLCTLSEWKVACRGDQNTRYPYGEKYRIGVCNVHGTSHPASILYGNASLGHWDPRLNQVMVGGAPLLRATGETPKCRSSWGADGVYDMVGNLDEWVEDDKSTFVGGFYARDTFRGCDARVSKHPPIFFDFTTGVRCCADRRDGKSTE
ncbi:MAG TPA: SUMF1/EgtB/PvdO family nonheme iron enzyme [Polyangiaceae bacterium]|nr:SUMF1/EgtB/PvdO family nonheme iron enzyme [Polyangiaceae bacterium]